MDARFLDHKGKRVWAVEIDELSVCGKSPEEGEERQPCTVPCDES